MRVAQLDMTKYANCPSGFMEGMYGSKKLCGSQIVGCSSTHFNTLGVPYTEVCEFVVAFQCKIPDAFRGMGAKIDSTYLDGLSLTYTMYDSF